MTAVAIPILTARAGRINEAHRKSTEAGRSMLAYAVEAGRELIEVKKGLPHGEFRSWVVANCACSYDRAMRYMRASKLGVDPNFEGTLEAFLDARAEKRTTETPTLDPDTASRILKLARMANGGNENEEVVAQEMLDKVAARFGMTGEQAQAEASKLCPEPPTFEEQQRKAAEFNARINQRMSAIRAEVQQFVEEHGSDRDALIEGFANVLYQLKYGSK